MDAFLLIFEYKLHLIQLTEVLFLFLVVKTYYTKGGIHYPVVISRKDTTMKQLHLHILNQLSDISTNLRIVFYPNHINMQIFE